MVDQFTLAPLDDKLAGLKAVGALTRKHAALLLRHKLADFSAQSSSAEVVAIPRMDPESGKMMVYAVNLNQAKKIEAGISISIRAESVRDIYSGAIIKVSGQKINLTLAPAQVMFLELK